MSDEFDSDPNDEKDNLLPDDDSDPTIENESANHEPAPGADNERAGERLMFEENPPFEIDKPTITKGIADIQGNNERNEQMPTGERAGEEYSPPFTLEDEEGEAEEAFETISDVSGENEEEDTLINESFEETPTEDEIEIPAAFLPDAEEDEAIVHILREDLRSETEFGDFSEPVEEIKKRPTIVSRLLGKRKVVADIEGLDDEEIERRLAFVRNEPGEEDLDADLNEIKDETPGKAVKTLESLEEQPTPVPAFYETPGEQGDYEIERSEDKEALGGFETFETQEAESLNIDSDVQVKENPPDVSYLVEDLATPDYKELRGVALEEYEEPVTPTPRQTIGQLTHDWWAGLSLIQRVTLLALIGLNLALVTIGLFLTIRALFLGFFPKQVEALLPIVTSEIPYPVEIRLPGGWAFSLQQANIIEGKWEPDGAEWLPGTEIQRWIAIPSSKELEAVFRTIVSGDLISLKMSNRDEWEYTVQEVVQVQADDLLKLSRNKPSILIYLVNDKSNTRWVVIAAR